MKTLVLGLGNELYGDDGIGIHVVEALKKELISADKSSTGILWPSGSIEFVASNSTGLALLDLILGYDRLIVIDTIKSDQPQTGHFKILKEKDLRYIPGPSPHYISFPQMLKIGREAGLPVPQEITIIAVETKNFYHLGEGLSAEMKASLPAIINKIKFLLGLSFANNESQTNNCS